MTIIKVSRNQMSNTTINGSKLVLSNKKPD